MAGTVRPYRTEDRETVLALFEKVWGKEKAEIHKRLWDWKHGFDYTHITPAQLSKVAIRDNKIVGYIGGIPQRFKINGTEYTGCYTLDAFVDPEYQRIGANLVREHVKDLDTMITGGHTRSFGLLCRILRRESIDAIDPVKMMYILDPSIYVSKNQMIRLFLRPCRWLWQILLSMKRPVVPQSLERGITIEKVNQFPRETDEVCRVFAEKFANISIRTQQYLNWRFAESPLGYSLHLIRKEQRLIGFFVYRRFVTPKGLSLLLSECCAIEHEKDIYALVFSFLIKEANAIGALRILTMKNGNPAMEEVFKKCGFIEKQADWTQIGGKFEGPAEDKASYYNKKKWYTSPADMDFEFLVIGI